jgi:hypothetical protein
MNLFVIPALYLRFGRPRTRGRDWRDELRLTARRASPQTQEQEPLTVMHGREAQESTSGA